MGVGRVMVRFPSVFKLSSLDGSNGFTIDGTDIVSLASAGDVNGDGFADVIVGMPSADNHQGAAYVVFGSGSGFDANIALSSLDGSNGFKIENTSTNIFAGFTVAGAGDVNGDGFDDVIVSAPFGAPGQSYGSNYTYGASYVVYGTNTGFPASVDLANLDGSNGFALDSSPFSTLGSSVAGAGDVNGDHVDDLIIGSFGDGGTAPAYVIFGSSAGFPAHVDAPALVNGTDGFAIEGPPAFSSSVAAADVNGDGFADLIYTTNYPATAYVVLGTNAGFPATVDVTDLDGTNGFAIVGADFGGSPYGHLTVASAGDINGDGFDDLVIGAVHGPSPYGTGPGADASYVVFGTNAGFPAEIDLSTLDGTNGFKIDPVSSSDLTGMSVAGIGDFNGDGFDDILIGAAGASPDGSTEAGSSYVLFGKASGFAAEVQLPSLNGDNGFRIDGASAGDMSGAVVSGAGDVNHDGYDDLLVDSITGASVILGGQDLAQIAPQAPIIQSATLNPDGSLTVSGLAEALADIALTEGGSSVAATAADSGGAWSATTSPLSDTVHDITVSASNAAGSSDNNGDVIVGTTGDDVLTAPDDFGPTFPRPTVILGRAGDDTLTTSLGGGDTLVAGDGGNSLLQSVGTGDNTLVGGSGNDTLQSGSSGYDVLQGGTGNNLLHALSGAGAGEMHSGSLAGGYNVLVDDSASRHTLNGGAGGDMLYAAGTGGDTLYAGDGNNLLQSSGSGNNDLEANGGDTLISGSSGRDTLVASGSGNLLTAQAGAGPGKMISNSLAGEHNTLIDESSHQHVLFGGAGGDMLFATGSGQDSLYAGSGNNMLQTSGSGDNYLEANGGDTLYSGSSGSDFLAATAGNNLLIAQAGSGSGQLVSYSTAADHNTLINQSLAQHTLSGGSGGDVLLAGNGGDVLNAGDGNNYLQGGSGADLLTAASVGNVTLLANGGGHDTLDASGSSGNNLFGLGFDNEEVFGGSGFNFYDDNTFLGTGHDRTINITAIGSGDILFFDHRSSLEVTSDTTSAGIRTILFNDNKTYHITDTITVQFGGSGPAP